MKEAHAESILICKFNKLELCHKREGSDCLIKTQDSAKLKNDV